MMRPGACTAVQIGCARESHPSWPVPLKIPSFHRISVAPIHSPNLLTVIPASVVDYKSIGVTE